MKKVFPVKMYRDTDAGGQNKRTLRNSGACCTAIDVYIDCAQQYLYSVYSGMDEQRINKPMHAHSS